MKSKRELLGDSFKSARKKLGLTQKELSDKVLSCDTEINKLEKGKRSFGFDKLEKYAEALNCSIKLVSNE